ncbi:unnamed protein product, partial [Effrenium voratum]
MSSFQPGSRGPLTGEGAARSASWHGRPRRSLAEEIVEGGGGKRCTVAGEEFEALDVPETIVETRQLSVVVAESFERMKRNTLLDQAYVQEIQQEEPGRLLWLRSSFGLIVQILLFSVYVGLDCGKTIFNSMALKGHLKIVSQSIPVCQSLLQIILGLVTAVSILGKPALAEVFNGPKILKFLPISLIFAAAQSFNVLSYTVLSGGTIKIVGQVRLLQTALLSKCLLGRSYQLTQWTTIGLIVLSAAIFCFAKQDDKERWDCYKALQDAQAAGSLTIPEACMMGAHESSDAATGTSPMALGMIYVFIYLILGDLGSIGCERFLKDEDDTPYYIQKTWQEIGSFPCSILMSFIVPLGQKWLGLSQKYWLPQMWWTEDERCSDESWTSQGTNLNYCGGFFRNWGAAAVGALLLSMSHSWLSGLVVKKLNSVVKLMGKCASLALVFFLGDCWLLRKQDPATVCMVSAVMVMLSTFTFM